MMIGIVDFVFQHIWALSSSFAACLRQCPKAHQNNLLIKQSQISQTYCSKENITLQEAS